MNAKEIAEILTFETLDLDWFNYVSELKETIEETAKEIEAIENSRLWYLLENLAYKYMDILDTDFYKHVKETAENG